MPSSAQSNLLGLLKFGTAPQATSPNVLPTENTRPPISASEPQSTHGSGISASDLVASLRGSGSKPPTPVQPTPRSTSASHQDSLLKLLNQTASAAEEAKPASITREQSFARDTPSPSRSSPQVRVFGSKEATPTPFQPEAISTTSTPRKTAPVFTYVNPFEQLSASSPLNADPNKRTKANDDAAKRGLKSPSPENTPAASRRKLTSSGHDVLQSIETPEQYTPNDGRTQEEAVKGIGAPSQNTETVAQALNEVGDQVHKQMEHALEEAESKQLDAQKAKAKTPVSTTENQSVDVDEAAEGSDLGILTYQIPMRPFVQIEVKKREAGASLREDAVVNIARFKKDFDQIDRVLATASKELIVYAAKAGTGGIRVIQQENGVSNLVLQNPEDRIFNVAVSSAAARPGMQCLIGTGISGTVYWTTAVDQNGELIEGDMDGQALIVPPASGGLDSTSNGQLKTRAKRSNRHPEFFAIGRGKSIQIVFPMHARQSKFINKENVLNTDGYFADRSLKVTTGKAGKDFAFSEDDTVIATLDKAGKLRLWDVRDLIHPDNATASILAPVEVKQPILSFTTANASEKIWPSSILFVDKIRSYQRGIAQRYIIVGMKQNHTLQLWDLCLGKAVQEVSFPHGKESDAICSVAFHPESSLIVVGHPTRNSIYVIQLSAPKFHLPGLSQAKLATRLASKDSTLPRTEATAIMSNFREYSVSKDWQLRSLDLAPPFADSAKVVDSQEDSQLFDLYVMHSKGVACLGFKKEDMGWSPSGKTLHPVDAVDEGHVIIKDLRETPAPSVADHASVSGDARPPTPSKNAPKSVSKDADKPERKTTPSITSKSSEKLEKKKSKQDVGESVPKALGGASEPVTMTPRESSPLPQPSSNGVKEATRPSAQKASSRSAPDSAAASTKDIKPLSNGESISLGISSDLLDKEMKKIEQGVSTEFNKALSRELEALHRRLDSDKQVHNATAAANQEAILRLVSKQLGDNVEKSLASIVLKSIKETVNPSIRDVAANELSKTLPHTLGQQIEHSLPLHLKSILPPAIKSVLQSNDVYRAISDQITSGIKTHIDREVIVTLQNSIIPKFQNMAISSAQKTSQEMESRIRAQLSQAEAQRREASTKIDQLSNSVHVLSETVHQMAEAQTVFQSEILRLQQKSLQDSQALVRQGSPTPSESASMQINPEQQEIDSVATLMQKGNYEEATITVSQPSRSWAVPC